MMSVGEIQRINREATKKASSKRERPRVYTESERTRLGSGELVGPIPFLADYLPTGWKVVNVDEDYFVDISGFGSPGEPAMTMQALARLIASKPADHGWALVEHGQFQGYVREYAPANN